MEAHRICSEFGENQVEGDGERERREEEGKSDKRKKLHQNLTGGAGGNIVSQYFSLPVWTVDYGFIGVG